MTYLNPADPYAEALAALEVAQKMEHVPTASLINQRAMVFATLAVAKAQLEATHELWKIRELLEKRNYKGPSL